MRYTTIGSDPATARRVSVLSLGAMRFGTTTDPEGLAPETIREQADLSRERLGMDRLDLYYAHVLPG